MNSKQIVWLMCSLVFLGCDTGSENGEPIDSQIGSITSAAVNGKQYFETLNRLNELHTEIRGLPDQRIRLRKVNEFADKIEGAVPILVESDYASYVVCVRRFKLNVGYAITLLEENENDPSARVRRYGRLLRKFKDLSFSVPWTKKGEDENIETFNRRLNAAATLLSEYLQELDSWKRFTFPKIKAGVPHSECEELGRLESELQTCPTYEDFKRSAFFGDEDETNAKSCSEWRRVGLDYHSKMPQ